MAYNYDLLVLEALRSHPRKSAGRDAGALIRGLTLWQPWSWLIAKGWNEESRPLPRYQRPGWAIGPKRIENRPRVLTKTRRVVLLHAGLTFDQDVEDDLRAAGFTVPREYAKGSIEAVAVLTGKVFRSLGEVPADQAFWWSGPVAMELSAVVALAEPVPCRGKQGLWIPPTDVVSRVRDQVNLDSFLREDSR